MVRLAGRVLADEAASELGATALLFHDGDGRFGVWSGLNEEAEARPSAAGSREIPAGHQASPPRTGGAWVPTNLR